MASNGTTKLFVGNIMRGSSPPELELEFSKFGRVVECDIISDYGFVHFEDGYEADTAQEAMHGAMFNGQKLKVEKSTSYVRQKPGAGSLDASSCYVCGNTGHWAKNCPEVPEHEREKQSRRAERGRQERRGGEEYPSRRPMGRDYYDDEYDHPPPVRRRPPPPDYYDDYDDYDMYYRRRPLPPPPRYYDPYDYDYPPRRRPPPPPGYYRAAADPYPPPPRRLPPVARERDLDMERPRAAAAAAAVPSNPVYYDFAEDSIGRKQPLAAAAGADMDPLVRGEVERRPPMDYYRVRPRTIPY